MDQRVSFITLGVAELARSLAFYEALGWRPSKYGDGAGVAFFALAGGMVLALYPRAELARDAGIEDSAGPSFGGVSLSYNTRSIEEAEQVLAEAGRAGGRILKAVEPVFWGGHVGYFADPDGHLWEVAYNPHASIAADGTVSLPS
jgi:catechol 2,3-dioxygenase-like lactoylglutathione lyase family enzyme